MGKLRSPVWGYFTKKSSRDAVCKYCDSLIVSSGNTTNLLNHLKSVHGIHLKKNSNNVNVTHVILETPAILSEGDIEMTNELENAQVVLHHDSRVYHSDDSESELQNRHTAIETFYQNSSEKESVVYESLIESLPFQDSKNCVVGERKDTELLEGILYMLSKDCLPLNVIEGDGFKQLMRIVAPNYKVPSIGTLKMMMDLKYECLVMKRKALLQNIDYFALAADVWTEKSSNQSFMGVTAHYISGTVNYSQCLSASTFYGNHSAESIRSSFGTILKFWNISRDQILVCVTDNDLCMVKAVKDYFGAAKHLPCFAHTINLVALEVMSAPLFTALKEKVKTIVLFFLNNSVAMEELIKEQHRQNLNLEKPLKLKMEVLYRWSSCFHMIECYLALHDCAIVVLPWMKNCPQILVGLELEELKESIMILKPLLEVSLEITGERHTSISKVIPFCQLIKLKFQKMELKTVLAREMHLILLDYIEKRILNMEKNENLAIATMLDPRFKKLHFNQALEVAKTLGIIDSLIKANDFSQLNSQEENETKSIWDHHDELMVNSVSQDVDQLPGSVSKSLKQYLQMPILPRKENPLLFWEQYKVLFPQLEKIAKKYLSISATSAPAERLFSKAGNIVCEKRKLLNGRRVDKQLFLGSIPFSEW